ncbi:MAG: TrmB family transcriptional regulator [bacterium]
MKLLIEVSSIKELIEKLQTLGFTENESKVYLELNKRDGLTGYEAAKQAAIPRPNAYSALQGLVEKGAAYKIQGEPNRYSAINIKELHFNLIKKAEDALTFIENNITVNPNMPNAFSTIEGDQNILTKISFLLQQAKQSIYLDVWKEDLDYLQKPLLQAEEKGVKVVVISVGKSAIPLQHLYEHGREEEWAKDHARGIHLIIDSSEALTGGLGKDKDSSALYSNNPNLVELIKESMVHEIILLEIKKNFGSELAKKFGPNLNKMQQTISCLRHNNQ